MEKKILVCGGGMWGKTLYSLLDRNNDVSIWDIDRGKLEKICGDIRVFEEKISRFFEEKQFYHNINVYFPSEYLPEDDSMKAAFEKSKKESLRAALKGKEMVFVAVPSEGIRDTMSSIADCLENDSIIVCCSKGLEEGTKKTHSMIMEEVLPKSAGIAVLSGPNLAMEILDGQPTATVVASRKKRIIKEVTSVFPGQYFKAMGSYDVVGVELSGALKNIIAIGSGICDGLGYEMNSKASLITRGLAEIAQIYLLYGARMETLYAGLAGIGDLIATCMSDKSRNHRFGTMLARGKTTKEAQEEIGMVVEGVHTLMVADEIIKDDKDSPYPIINGLHSIVFNGSDPKDAIRNLLNTPGRLETLYMGRMMLSETLRYINTDYVTMLVNKGIRGKELSKRIYENALRTYYSSLVNPDKIK